MLGENRCLSLLALKGLRSPFHCSCLLFVYKLQAALDGHFGIWTVSSLDTGQKGHSSSLKAGFH